MELVQSPGMIMNALAAKAGKVATALTKNSVSGDPVLSRVFANPWPTVTNVSAMPPSTVLTAPFWPNLFSPKMLKMLPTSKSSCAGIAKESGMSEMSDCDNEFYVFL